MGESGQRRPGGGSGPPGPERDWEKGLKKRFDTVANLVTISQHD
jgi:hypothetical protein